MESQRSTKTPIAICILFFCIVGEKLHKYPRRESIATRKMTTRTIPHRLQKLHIFKSNASPVISSPNTFGWRLNTSTRNKGEFDSEPVIYSGGCRYRSWHQSSRVVGDPRQICQVSCERTYPPTQVYTCVCILLAHVNRVNIFKP